MGQAILSFQQTLTILLKLLSTLKVSISIAEQIVTHSKNKNVREIFGKVLTQFYEPEQKKRLLIGIHYKFNGKKKQENGIFYY